MNLSSLYSGFQGYYEYAWVTSASAAEQSINANANTTLTIDEEIADTLGNGSVNTSTNVVTIPAGTYHFHAEAAFRPDIANPAAHVTIFGLYNGANKITANRLGGSSSLLAIYPNLDLSGTFVLSSTGSLTLRVLSNVQGGVGNSTDVAPAWSGGDSGTDGIDQRTTLRLWKLK